MTGPGRAAATVYVGVVAVLAAASFHDPGQVLTWFPEGVMLLLLLPALVPLLPVVYVLGASVWDLAQTGADRPMWPVTTLFVLLFAGVAVVNVLLVRLLGAWWSRGRRAADSSGHPAGVPVVTRPGPSAPGGGGPS